VVVEHEPSVMGAADQLIDLGPGHGEAGGQLVFQGTFGEMLKARSSITGQYRAVAGPFRFPSAGRWRPQGAPPMGCQSISVQHYASGKRRATI
jgi:excinuclease UvrABC ATPase subunit